MYINKCINKKHISIYIYTCIHIYVYYFLCFVVKNLVFMFIALGADWPFGPFREMPERLDVHRGENVRL